MKVLRVAIYFVLFVFLVGCATIMNGINQEIGVSSTPPGAIITVDGENKGSAPSIIKMSRRNSHTITMELPGYRPYSATVTSNGVSGWIWGNIFFGGVVGLIVDFSTGGIYILNPEQLQANLEKEGIKTSFISGDTLYISATLRPNPEWEKVGQLTQN